MADQSGVSKKLQAFLDELSPQARRMLVASIEAAKNRGEERPQFDAILSLVRPAIRKDGAVAPRRDLVMRAFYEPFSPFFYDNFGNTKFPGRIARASLVPIWTWITRDVLPQRIDEMLQKFDGQPDSGEERQLEACAEQLRGEAFPLIRSHLEQLREVPRGLARLSVQLGNNRVLRDLEDLLAIEAHPELWNVLAMLPERISALDVAPGAPVMMRIEQFLDDYGGDGFWLAAGILGRLERPGLLAKIATGLSGSDNGKAIAASKYGVFVEAALHEMDGVADKFRHFLHNRAPDDKLIDCLKDYHSIQRKLVVEIDLDSEPEWVTKLANARRQLSELIKAEIETTAGMVNRALRYNPGADRQGKYDEYLVTDAERALLLLVETRRVIDSLALNELLVTTWRRVEQALEILSANLIQRLRGAPEDMPEDERQIIVGKLEAAIRFSAMIFGEDYARSLRRSSANAVSQAGKKNAAG